MIGGWIDRLTGRTEISNLTTQVAVLEQKASQVFDYTSLFLNGYEVPLHPGGGSGGPYGNSWVAYSCISRIARDAAGIDLKFLRDPADMESELPATHPLVKMFKNPNPYFSTSEFIEWLLTIQMLRGEFFILFDDPMRPTQMMQYTEPNSWKEVIEGGNLVGWEYRNRQDHFVRLNDELLFHRMIDPARPYRGQSPLQAAMVNYQIDTGVDTLQADVVKRGGETSAMFAVDTDLGTTQRAQLIASLKARRSAVNRVASDVLLPYKVTPVDPKFLASDNTILEAQSMQPDKICAVFGLSKSLLGFEDIDKYATFQGRLKVYFMQTLVPLLSGIEDAFDSYFIQRLPPSYGGYVRFDWAKSPAFQESLSEQMTAAGVAHDKGLPWTVLNDAFKLGLDVGSIPAADQVLVSSALAPIESIVETWTSAPNTPPAVGEQSPAGGDKSSRLTNVLIRKRAADPVALIARGMRLLKLERALRTGYKKEIFEAMRKAERIIKAADGDTGKIKLGLTALGDTTLDAVLKFIGPLHEDAANEGILSIVALVDGKMTDQGREIFRKAHNWNPEITDAIKNRQNHIKKWINVDHDALFNDVQASVLESVTTGAEYNEVVAVARARFHSARGGINRAITIARTEIGSAYNVARHEETKAQGFEWHQWLTASDEFVRGATDDFDHAQCNDEVRKLGKQFPCGLTYPMEDGGDAGNVINCRCETIPVLTKDG